MSGSDQAFLLQISLQGPCDSKEEKPGSCDPNGLEHVNRALSVAQMHVLPPDDLQANYCQAASCTKELYKMISLVPV